MDSNCGSNWHGHSRHTGEDPAESKKGKNNKQLTSWLTFLSLTRASVGSPSDLRECGFRDFTNPSSEPLQSSQGTWGETWKQVCVSVRQNILAYAPFRKNGYKTKMACEKFKNRKAFGSTVQLCQDTRKSCLPPKTNMELRWHLVCREL